MPRRSKGVRKYLRKRAGRDAVWVILDGAIEISTGCVADDVAGADRALQHYLAKRHKPDFRRGDPESVSAADVMIYYIDEKAPQAAAPGLIGTHMLTLGSFFGGLMVSQINPKACRDYVKGREAGTIGKRAVKAATARRELETLQAALNFAYHEQKLLYPVKLSLPKKSPARTRWLTRSEVARLLAGALGFVPTACDVETRQLTRWRRQHQSQPHLARFILIGLYTGTRHDAILKLHWDRSNVGGWFDLDQGILYRRGEGEVETNKRRPPVAIPGVLMEHLAAWRKNTTVGPIEYHGDLIGKEKTAFNNARDRVFLDRDVTPHTLRHTCATWQLNEGRPVWDVAGFLGTSDQVIRSTYGHHAIDTKEQAKNRFRGRKMGEDKNGKGRL